MFGVGVALSPLAIVAVVVMLVASSGTRPAWAFAAAWALSLAVACTLVLLLADEADASSNGEPATWVSVLKIGVGLLLVMFAVVQWRGRESHTDSEAPPWMRKLNGITVTKAASLATVFAVVKPKNLLLTIAAGLAVAQVGAHAIGQALAVGVFVVLSTAGLAIPLAIHLFMRDRGTIVLTDLRDWMVRENTTIIAVLCLVIAAKLLSDALISLAS